MVNPQLFTTFSGDAQTFIAANLLQRIKRDLIVYNLGKKEKLPNRFSKTFQFTRFEKLNLPTQALTEGATPSSNSSLSITPVTAVMDQWGSFVSLTDVIEVTVKHPVMQQAIVLMGEQANEVIERECVKVLLANSSVIFPNSVASRATIDASDIIDSNTVQRGVASLRAAGAHPVEGRSYMGIMDPFVEADLMDDPTFVAASSYSNIMALFNAEAGKWKGARWMVSNFIPSLGRLAAPSSSASNSTGSLTVGTTYYFKVTKVDPATGYEIATSAEFSQATGGSDDTISITMPTATGYVFNVYMGSVSGTLYLSSYDNASAASVDVLTVATSGNTPPSEPATGVTVHFSWLLGQEAFAVPELMSLQTFLTPAGASDSDPLAQRRKASWKVMFKAVICNESYIKRIESASAYS